MWWLPDKTPIHLSKPTYYITSSRKPLWSLQIKLITPSSDLPLSRDYLHLYLFVWAMIWLSKKLSPLRVTGSRIRPGVHAKSLQSCLTLCNPMDYSLPGSSVHGILQARILKRVAKTSSRGSSRSRDRACVSYLSCVGGQALYHQYHLGSLGSGHHSSNPRIIIFLHGGLRVVWTIYITWANAPFFFLIWTMGIIIISILKRNIERNEY